MTWSGLTLSSRTSRSSLATGAGDEHEVVDERHSTASGRRGTSGAMAADHGHGQVDVLEEFQVGRWVLAPDLDEPSVVEDPAVALEAVGVTPSMADLDPKGPIDVISLRRDGVARHEPNGTAATIGWSRARRLRDPLRTEGRLSGIITT
jgi:hypothetical protein